MIKRKPVIYNVSTHTYIKDDEGRLVPRNGIFVNVKLTGIKDEPIEAAELTEAEALSLIAQLAGAILQYQRNEARRGARNGAF